MILRIRSEKDQIVNLYPKLKKAADETDLGLQTVYANHLVLKATGFLENSVRAILQEYCNRHANEQIGKFVAHKVSRLNSLSTGKLETLFNSFEPTNWAKISDLCTDEDISSVDSIKTIRDDIAHGKTNGTGLLTVNRYFTGICNFVGHVEKIILP